MARKIVYWVSTGLIAALSAFAAFAYLSGSPQAVQGFAHDGHQDRFEVRHWVGSAEVLPLLVGKSPSSLVLSGLTGIPFEARLAMASGMLLARLPPSETVAGLLTTFELLTKARTPS